jgi:calcium-dependent protein kinase
MNKDKILANQNLETAFKVFDKDGSGKISVEEIQMVFNQKDVIEKSVYEQILKAGDKNGDGELSLEEFKELMIEFFAS